LIRNPPSFSSGYYTTDIFKIIPLNFLENLGKEDLRRATHHASVGNEEFYKLALIGDAVLNLYLVLKFYERRSLEEIYSLISEYKSNKASTLPSKI